METAGRKLARNYKLNIQHRVYFIYTSEIVYHWASYSTLAGGQVSITCLMKANSPV